MDAMGTMRDLDQIRERDEPGGTSRLMSLALGGMAGACVLFAVGVLVGREAADTRPAPADDPLARLDRLAHQAEAASAATTLTYAERLAAEPTPSAPPPGAAAIPTAVDGARGALGALPPMAAHVPVSALLTSAGRVALAAPAAAGAPQGIRLTMDPAPVAPGAVAPSGADGAFTIQVSSFRAPGSAQTFAQRLRERGHRAFVVTGATPTGGTWHRVRIGPFASVREANAYRTTFETRERMPSIVVRRDPGT